MKRKRRPYTNPKWLLPTKVVRIPEIYAIALVEIALEWQSTRFASED